VTALGTIASFAVLTADPGKLPRKRKLLVTVSGPACKVLKRCCTSTADVHDAPSELALLEVLAYSG